MKKIYKKKPTNVSKHYVNNRTFYESLIEYKADLKRFNRPGSNMPPEMRPPIPKYVGECIMLICTRLGFRPNFLRYTYRDECIGDAIENCVAAVNNFDPNKTNNPFAYFTQIAFNAFIRRIQHEKKQAYVRYKNYENTFTLAEMQDHLEGDDNKLTQKGTNVNVDEFVANFERTMNKAGRNKKKRVAKLLA